MTPAIFHKYIKAYQDKLRDQLVMADQANHLLGHYIRTAVSDVLAGKRNYPRKPFLDKTGDDAPQSTLKRRMTREETEAFLRQT